MKNARKLLVAAACIGLTVASTGSAQAKKAEHWQVGTPVTTYYAGPALADGSAVQMKTGGFNVVWSSEQQMDIAQKHGLRVFLQDPLIAMETMDDPAKVAKLDALIARIKNHPAMYGYYIIDEPGAAQFPALGKLVSHLHAQDPAHMAYINLFPTYANNDQLGVPGDTVVAYKEYLRRFVDTVKPDMLSYDHYHFTVNGDNDQYFLNLGMIRQAALDANIPFLNIVQACTWDPSMRAPNGDEMRWLNYTSLAYGAQGLSYFVYSYPPFYEQFKEKAGQLMRPDGTTTPQYDAAKQLNPQFVAIASQLQPLRSIGAYHVGKEYRGAENLPDKAPFHLTFSAPAAMPDSGMVLGYFGAKDKHGKAGAPTHVLVVNLDYRHPVSTTVVGPRRLWVFDTETGRWKKASGPQAIITLPPGGGTLVRVGK